MLSARERVRFARHLALPEIGEAGQVALRADDGGPSLPDAAAEAVRRLYLARAGLAVGAAPERRVDRTTDAPSPGSDAAFVDLDGLAGRPSLRHAAAALVGAFAATEHIKRVVGAGSPASFPTSFRLLETD